jgi:hypothetical protein
MERPVRSAWAQDAIVEPRLVPSSVLTPDFRRGTGPFFRSELSRQERNFRLQRRLVKIGCGDAITIRRDGISRTTTSNVPARTPFFRWGVVSAVWKDCMVGATGIEPVTPSMSTRCSPAELRALRLPDGWRSYIGSKAARQGYSAAASRGIVRLVRPPASCSLR